MKQLKVTVSGLYDETFIGNEVDVEKYLKSLKERQINNMTKENLDFYKKNTTKSKTNHMNNAHVHNDNLKKYEITPERCEFQQSQRHLSMKIKIEEDNNEFF